MSMRAVVLAGGEGRRLRPFTWVVPKPLVPIGEMPILEILLRQLARYGFVDVTLSVGYLWSLISAYCGDGAQWGLRIDYVREDEPLGTAGFLPLIDTSRADRLLVVNGDILTDLDFRRAYETHVAGATAATIFSHHRTVDIDFGVLDIDSDGMLLKYDEKPKLTYQVSMGINVISTWAIERYIEHGVRLDMPVFMRRLQAAHESVRVEMTDCYWLDMGRMADLEAANTVIESERERFLP
jgi:NDP-sugar pyrophosphorylase family protein